jgi:antitoxin VapB
MPKQLNVRDPRAAVLAKRLGRLRGQSMTEATIYALEAAIRQEQDKERAPLAERLDAIARDLRAKGGANGREVTREEIDAMWGH